MESQKSQLRVIYFDMLNIFATLCVILLHFNNEIHWYSPTTVWKQSVVVQAVAYWAFPVIFMLAGAILMNYRQKYTTLDFLKKRTLKVVIPFFIWSAIFIVWRLSRNELPPLPTSSIEKQWAIVDIIINNKMEPIYWIFAPLISIYLSIPALSCFATLKNRNILNYLLFIGIISVTILPFVYNLINTTLNTGTGWWNSSWQPAILGGYLIYPITGFWISRHDFSLKTRLAIYSTGIVMFFLRLGGIYYFSARDGVTNTIFLDYLCFLNYSYAFAVFVLFKYIPWERLLSFINIRYIAKLLSQCSVGIYFIHMLLLTYMQESVFFAEGRHENIWHFVAPFICYIICVLFVLLVKRIPLLHYLFP